MASASQNLDLGSVPQALEDELNLVAGKRYLTENVGETLIRLRVAADQPGADSRGHQLGPYETITVIVVDGFRTWAWSRDPDGAKLIITEETV